MLSAKAEFEMIKLWTTQQLKNIEQEAAQLLASGDEARLALVRAAHTHGLPPDTLALITSGPR